MSQSATSSSWTELLADGARAVGGRIRAVAPRRRDLVAMLRTPRADLIAGLTVGVVALPLALAFGIASGVGATAGLVTAVVAGTVAALFGGSAVQVSGPTGAMTVVLVPIVGQFGSTGVLVVGLLAGLMLVAMGLAGLGAYVRYIPLPVIEGFTLGIAVIIALQQVPAALGVKAHGEQVLAVASSAVWTWVQSPTWAAPTIAITVAAALLVWRRVKPSVPVALLAVAAATTIATLAHLPVSTIGTLPTELPTPRIPDMTWWDVRTLAIPAVAVAALAALESLLSATVADAMSVSGRHDPDRELFGQGLANIASPLFGGIPATAAIARTAVNVRSGAQSRLAAVTHAVVLLVVVLALSGIVAMIPLAALAGVLIGTAARMVEVSAVRALVGSSRSDAVVFVITFLATVVLDLATAVVIGIIVAGGLALRHVARSAGLRETPLSDIVGPDDARAADETEQLHTAEERALLDERIVAFRFEGPLFFAGAHTALMELTDLGSARVAILRLSHVTSVDATGAAVLTDTIRALGARGVTVLLSGLQRRHEAPLRATGILDHLRGLNHVFADTPAAIAHARRHVARDHHHEQSEGLS